jgi:hypothetical protein
MPLVSQARDLRPSLPHFCKKARRFPELATFLSTVLGGVSGNPPLPHLTLPFPRILPGNCGGFAFRPGHHHRITLAR